VAWEAGLGLALGMVIGWLGRRRDLLSSSGAVAVAAISALTFGAGGWVWGTLCLVVLVSSGLSSTYASTYKEPTRRNLGVRQARDGSRVVVAMGWATAVALLNLLAPGDADVFAAFVGALAATNADVWASEMGMLSSQVPRLITSRRRVAAGTPGAISVLGVVAALVGGWLVGFLGLLLVVIRAWITNLRWDRTLLWLPIAATTGGMAGSLLDSFLGAAAQGIYYCERCETETEQRIHFCGESARQIRGWAWLTSDGIDLVSSIVGAAVVAGALYWLAQTSIWW